MKVRVEFEADTKAGETLTTGINKTINVLSHDEQGNPVWYNVFKSWCTPVCVDEPTVHGTYKLRNEGGIFYAQKQRYYGFWLLFGVDNEYVWEDFDNVIEVEKLESDEGTA